MEAPFCCAGVRRFDVALALQRSFEVSRDELCRQLAYASAGDATSYDVTKLAYSLATYVSVCDARERVALLFESSDDTAGPRPQVEAPNLKLCALALDSFFGEQGRDGAWPAGRPRGRQRVLRQDTRSPHLTLEEERW